MVVMSQAASALASDSISDKEALKTVTNLVKQSSGKHLLTSQNEVARQPEVLEGCAKLLTRTNSKLQAKAAQAIGTYAYGSETVASQIVQAPGMLDNLATIMEQDDKSAQLEAARTVCNCASYSREAAEAIVANANLLSALQGLCGSKDANVKAKAIAAVSSLSAYPSASETLKNTGIVNGALMPVVGAKKGLFGSNDTFQVTRLDAMTAVVNLGGSVSLGKAATKEALKSFKACLEASLKGKPWAGATWTPAITLGPLSKLANDESVRPLFAELKFVKVFANAFATCASIGEQAMAMQCLANVSQDGGCLQSMRKPKYNLVPLLQAKLSCEHSKQLAAYLVDIIQKEETPSHNDSNTEEVSEKKDGNDTDDDTENMDPRVGSSAE